MKTTLYKTISNEYRASCVFTQFSVISCFYFHYGRSDFFFTTLSFDQKTALLFNLNAGKCTLKIIQLYWDLFFSLLFYG